MGKNKRLPSPPTTVRALKPGQTVHLDLWGPSPVASRGGKRYFLTCYDDNSRRKIIYLLKGKSETTACVIEYVKLVENQLGTTVKLARSDLGGEFEAGKLDTFFKSKGIEHHQIPPTAHAQNGRVERAHLTIANDMRTLLVDSKLGPEFWADAATYAVYTRNRIPGKDQKESPEAIWYGRPPKMDHLQPFGADAFYRDYRVKGKLAARGRKARLLGYQPGTSYYRLLDVITTKTVQSRDVTFTEGGRSPSTPITPTTPLLPRKPTVQNQWESDHEDNVTEDEEEEEARARERPAIQPAVHGPPALHHPGWAYEEDPRYNREAAPSPELPDGEDESEDDTPAGPRRSGREHRVPARYAGIAYIAALTAGQRATSNPQTYQEARESNEWQHWDKAMNEELDKMKQYGVWEAVENDGQRTLDGKWVFTRKTDGTSGLPSAYKARYVVKGFRQIEGKDYSELFASVAHKDSIRVFLSIVNHLDLECHQVDIKGAFLNGVIDKLIYLTPPDGSDIPANKILRLNKSLYGLKQSPRLFNQTLDKWLRSTGMVPTTADSCVYVRRKDGNFLMLSVHVDDQLIAGNNLDELTEFKRQLNDAFECSDAGPVGYFLGFNIYRDRPNKRLYISQEHYIEALLEKYGMADCNPARTPLPSGFRPVAATEEEFAEAKDLPFPQIAGALLYAATITRPDISFAASVLCRFISKWNKSHWQAAKHLLRYLRGTTDLALTYDAKASQRVVLGYADADWGGCLDTRRSTTGYVFKTYGGTVAWKSRRQTTVALSTTQAEVLALTDAARQAEWLRQLLDDLGLGLATGDPLPILNDNMGAVLLSKHPHNHTGTKHFDIRTSYLREKRDDKTITVDHVASKNNHADILTKGLPAELGNDLRDQLGLLKVTKQPEVGTSGSVGNHVT